MSQDFRDALLNLARDEHTSSYTLRQLALLLELDDAGIADYREVSRALRMPKPSLTRACDRLVSDGMLTRSQSSDDRRRVTLAITPAGRDFLAHRVGV